MNESTESDPYLVNHHCGMKRQYHGKFISRGINDKTHILILVIFETVAVYNETSPRAVF